MSLPQESPIAAQSNQANSNPPSNVLDNSIPEIQPKPRQPFLKIVPVGDLSKATLSPTKFVMEPYFPKRHVSLLGGHGDAGKTYLAEVHAAHIATGTCWAGLTCQRGKVLFVSLEDEPNLMDWRLALICKEYGLDITEVSRNITYLDGTETAATLAKEIGNGKELEKTEAWQELADAMSGYSTVIIDNASDAFTANANDPALVRIFLKQLQMLARQYDAAIILLAHIDKAGAKNGTSGNSYAGTAAWHNTVRSRVAYLFEKGTWKLVHEKHNLSKGADDLFLSKTDIGVPIPMTQSDVQQNEASATALLAIKKAPEILELLRKAIENGENISPTRKGNYTAWHVLKNYNLTNYEGKRGKGLFWAAIDHLCKNDFIKKESYKSDDYKMKEKIVICPQMPQAEESSQ